MYTSGYSTITKESLLQAVGPFLSTTKDQLSGSIELAKASIHITWSSGLASPRSEMSTNRGIEKSLFVQEVYYSEELINTAYATMLASEMVLSKDWDSPEEDAAWADL